MGLPVQNFRFTIHLNTKIGCIKEALGVYIVPSVMYAAYIIL